MTSVKIYPGDCLKVLAALTENSIHCVITSPPYYGLRDYQVEPSIWGGDADCKHGWNVDGARRTVGNNSAIRGANETETVFSVPKSYTGNQRIRVGRNDTKRDIPGGHPRGPKGYSMPEASTVLAGSVCQKCGAWRGALGLEPTVEMYLEHMVAIFREVRRVLRKDGTLWLNMGDSYVSAPPGNDGKFNPETDKDGVYKRRGERQLGHGEDMQAIYGKARWREGSARADGKLREDGATRRNRDGVASSSGLKQKDLIGMPWRLALALQADGWYLRQDVIWQKPNPMPESTTDRCTKAHEYFFMLSKSARYYYDQEAIAEPVAVTSIVRVSGGSFASETPGDRDYSVTGVNENSVFRAMKNFARAKPLAGSDGFVNTFVSEAPSKSGNKARKPASVRGVPMKAADTPRNDGERWNENNGRGFTPTGGDVAGSVPWEGWTRNKRSVWTIPVQPFPGSHFAVFPPALVRPAILACCPQRCCAKCGAPMVREFVDTGHVNRREPARTHDNTPTKVDSTGWAPTRKATNVWVPTCKHDADMVPGVVLDPFGGSGTVAAEGVILDRDVVLIELSPKYVEMIMARLGRPGFLAPTVEVVRTGVRRFIPESKDSGKRQRRDHQAAGG